ncbi:MAG TPA: shikimate dehydrogenase [Nocardioidaceae bacterium]|nr:shikimate dehydrogenase [Nocardioidaceae bacterium]
MLGSPISHSLSPVLHRTAYAELGLAWDYSAHEVTEATLPGFLDGLDAAWRGLSLTMPLKRAVVPLLDELSARAAQAAAANTVVLEDGRRTGHNTDVPGVTQAVRERYDGPVTRAVVVGGGATAASAVLGLADLGCRQFTVLVREESRAAETVAAAARHPGSPAVDVRRIGSPAPDADILVSTIPADAQRAEVVALGEEVRVVFDVIYDPWPTPLASGTRATGAVLVSGLDLLVHQAALQVELMTGAGEAPLEAMREAGERALAARAEPPGRSDAGPV